MLIIKKCVIIMFAILKMLLSFLNLVQYIFTCVLNLVIFLFVTNSRAVKLSYITGRVRGILSFKKLKLKVGVNFMNSQHLRLKWHFEKLDKYRPWSQSNRAPLGCGGTTADQLRDAIMSIWTKISEECFQHLDESATKN